MMRKKTTQIKSKSPRRRTILFPYTTLFRSIVDAHEEHGIARVKIDGTPSLLGYSSAGKMLYAVDRDRKSTRLNSSHSQISYAVFCLKKKRGAGDQPCPGRMERR